MVIRSPHKRRATCHLPYDRALVGVTVPLVCRKVTSTPSTLHLLFRLAPLVILYRSGIGRRVAVCLSKASELTKRGHRE